MLEDHQEVLERASSRINDGCGQEEASCFRVRGSVHNSRALPDNERNHWLLTTMARQSGHQSVAALMCLVVRPFFLLHR